jgi:hypothetical protein
MGPRFDRRTLTILGGVSALVVLVVGAGLLLTRKTAGANGGQAKTLYVNRLLHLRSAPGATGSAVLGDLHRGDTVTGIVITGSDGVTQWLKISGNGQPDRFVWAKNLSPTPRPPLSSNTEADLLLANQAAAMAEPNSAAPVIETEAAGATVHETGEVAGGWYEIELARGGVGYVLKSSVQPAPSAAPGPVSQSNTVEAFNQICPQALANAQATDFVPYIAKLVTLNAQPISSDHYVCAAEGRAITYSITARVRCNDFSQARCVQVMRVITDSGKVLWQGLE